MYQAKVSPGKVTIHDARPWVNPGHALFGMRYIPLAHSSVPDPLTSTTCSIGGDGEGWTPGPRSPEGNSSGPMNPKQLLDLRFWSHKP